MRHEPWQEEILESGELYRVGGIVRDRVMGAPHPSEDVDYLVRMISPEHLEEILSRHGTQSLVGRSFGVYKFRPRDGEEVDIVFPRRERSTGPGHRDFEVDWDWRLPLEDDLGRRDFTMNAMAEDVATGRRIDPYGGEKDIDERVVRMVFERAFEEDPLRILRGIRFATRFDFDIEKGTWREMVRRAPGVEDLSSERVQEELTRLLTECKRPSAGFRLMHDAGVLRIVIPELDRCAGVTQNEFHPDDVFVHSLLTCDAAPRDDLLVRWAALLHDVGKVDTKQVVHDDAGERVVFYGHETVSADAARALLGRLRYPSSFVADCVALVEQHMFRYTDEWRDATVRRFIHRVGEPLLESLFALREADCRSRDLDEELENLARLRERVETEIARGRTFRVTDLAIDGADVMRVRGIAPGPAVGRVLDQLLDAVLESPERNTREELEKIASQLKLESAEVGKLEKGNQGEGGKR